MKIFGKCSETVVKPSEQFWKIFGNLRKEVANLGKVAENVVITMFIYLTEYSMSAYEYEFCLLVFNSIYIELNTRKIKYPLCMSYQSDWNYYKQPIKFLVVNVNGM